VERYSSTGMKRSPMGCVAMDKSILRFRAGCNVQRYFPALVALASAEASAFLAVKQVADGFPPGLVRFHFRLALFGA